MSTGTCMTEQPECLYRVRSGTAFTYGCRARSANTKPECEVREMVDHSVFFHQVNTFILHPQMKRCPAVCWSPEDALLAPHPSWSDLRHPVCPSPHRAASATGPTVPSWSPAPLPSPCLRCPAGARPDGIPHPSRLTLSFPKGLCACRNPTGTVPARSSPCPRAQTPATSSAGKTHN